MDLHQLIGTVGRHKTVAVLGVAAAILFALLAFVRVDPFGDPVLTYRKPSLWSSTVTLQLTQQGFPEGRVIETANRREALIQLAPLYARLANTDDVKRRMRTLGPITGKVGVRPVIDENRSSLPLVEISSFAYTPGAALTRVRRQANAFISVIADEQVANDVRPENRVVLEIINRATPPNVVEPRKVTLPVIVFLSMLVLTGGLILVLDNLTRGGAAKREGGAEPGEGGARETRSLEAISNDAPTKRADVGIAETGAAGQEVPAVGRGTARATRRATLGSDSILKDAGRRDGTERAASDASEAVQGGSRRTRRARRP